MEFKEKYTPKIDRDIVAFANTKGGRILLGVTDDGRIAGETLTNRLKAEILEEVHEDRVVVSNPGGFPAGMTEQKLGALSVRRNELIADIFARMNKVERMGSGFKRIREHLAAAGLPFPEMESDSFFIITFKRPGVPQSTPQRTPQKGSQKSNQKSDEKGNEKSDEKTLRLISENPAITTAVLSAELNLSLSGIAKIIRNLKKAQKLRRIGPDKGGHWEVNLT